MRFDFGCCFCCFFFIHTFLCYSVSSSVVDDQRIFLFRPRRYSWRRLINSLRIQHTDCKCVHWMQKINRKYDSFLRFGQCVSCWFFSLSLLRFDSIQFVLFCFHVDSEQMRLLSLFRLSSWLRVCCHRFGVRVAAGLSCVMPFYVRIVWVCMRFCLLSLSLVRRTHARTYARYTSQVEKKAERNVCIQRFTMLLSLSLLLPSLSSLSNKKFRLGI